MIHPWLSQRSHTARDQICSSSGTRKAEKSRKERRERPSQRHGTCSHREPCRQATACICTGRQHHENKLRSSLGDVRGPFQHIPAHSHIHTPRALLPISDWGWEQDGSTPSQHHLQVLHPIPLIFMRWILSHSRSPSHHCGPPSSVAASWSLL